MTARGESLDVLAGSHEEFITEHYWGYTARSQGTLEYQVEHPQWHPREAEAARLSGDAERLSGPKPNSPKEVRLRSATNFRSFVVSSRNCFASCASLTFIPPYFAFQA